MYVNCKKCFLAVFTIIIQNNMHSASADKVCYIDNGAQVISTRRQDAMHSTKLLLNVATIEHLLQLNLGHMDACL